MAQFAVVTFTTISPFPGVQRLSRVYRGLIQIFPPLRHIISLVLSICYDLATPAPPDRQVGGPLGKARCWISEQGWEEEQQRLSLSLMLRG